MASASSAKKIATTLGLAFLFCSGLGVISAIFPFPVIVGALFGLFAVTGWLLYLNIDGPKGLKIALALLSILLNIGGMWYFWTWLVSDFATANYLLTGGFKAISEITNSAVSGRVTVRGTDLGDSFLFYTAVASTFAVAFPPAIWGILSNNSTQES